MMRKIGLALAFSAALISSAFAQGGMQPGPGTPASAGGGGYVGPGDTSVVATTPYSWWGLRAVSASYAASTGNIADLVAVTGGAAVCTLKAATDGTADMVGTYCPGTLTVPAACAAASGGSCKVTKLYDQISTRHLINATLAQMPVFNATGNGTKPSMDFSGSTVFMQATSVAPNAGSLPFSVSSVLYLTTAGAFRGRYERSGSNPLATTNAAGTAFTMNSGTLFTSGNAVSTATWYALQETWNNASSASYQNGSNSTGTSGATAFTSGTLNWGAGGGNFWVGRYSEFGIWSIAFSGADQSALNSNQRTYWGF